MAWFVFIGRPETGTVRCEHFVSENYLAIVIKAKFKFCISYDYSAIKSMLCAFFIKRYGKIAKLPGIFFTLSRERLLKVIYAFFK